MRKSLSDIIFIRLLCLLFFVSVFNCSRIQLKTGIVARSFNLVDSGEFPNLYESGPLLIPLELLKFRLKVFGPVKLCCLSPFPHISAVLWRLRVRLLAEAVTSLGLYCLNVALFRNLHQLISLCPWRRASRSFLVHI